MPVGDYDPGLAADITENLVVGAGEYVTAVATHEAEFPTGRGGLNRRGSGGGAVGGFVPGIGVAGSG